MKQRTFYQICILILGILIVTPYLVRGFEDVLHTFPRLIAKGREVFGLCRLLGRGSFGGLQFILLILGIQQAVEVYGRNRSGQFRKILLYGQLGAFLLPEMIGGIQGILRDFPILEDSMLTVRIGNLILRGCMGLILLVGMVSLVYLNILVYGRRLKVPVLKDGRVVTPLIFESAQSCGPVKAVQAFA